MTEFNHIRNNALEPLSTFLDYITYIVYFLLDFFRNAVNSLRGFKTVILGIRI